MLQRGSKGLQQLNLSRLPLAILKARLLVAAGLKYLGLGTRLITSNPEIQENYLRIEKALRGVSRNACREESPMRGPTGGEIEA